MVFGAVFGVCAGAALCYATARYGPPAWAQPAEWLVRRAIGRPVVVGVSALAIGLWLAWIYAAWFDALLRGIALVRGAKFGVLTAVWVLLLLAGTRIAGLVAVSSTHVMQILVGAALVCVAFGLMVGVLYGAGRRHDDYRSGLGYGVTDRRSLA
jgi:hypothetical protein